MPLKNKVLWAACFSVLLLAGGQDQLPIAIHQVQPEYGPDLSQGYTVEHVKVELVVGADGIPYSVSPASLPDSVTTALSRWRFQPGKKDGRDTASSVTINVPVRRAIATDIERTYGSWRLPPPKELGDALKAGEELDAAGANKLRESLAAGSADINSRAALLAYYANPAIPNSEEVRKARLDQIVWLVQNAPESNVLANPVAQINAQGDPLQDPSGYEQVRKLWLDRLAANPGDTSLVARAISILRIADPERAEELCITSATEEIFREACQGRIYGLAALGVTGFDLKKGLPFSAAPRIPDTPYAQKARSALMSTDKVSLLMYGLATVTLAGKSLDKSRHLPAGYAELCNGLLNRAKQMQPAITTSCDPSGPIPELDQTIQRIRVGGNVQAANLIKKVQPTYPAEAKSRHIEGTVRFRVIIDKGGKIATMTLLSGPLPLYESARDAVRQWVYKPALFNGKPVEVLTQIDVNYILTR